MLDASVLWGAHSYEMFTLFDEALLLSLHGTTVYA
jgi:hypothetical protein